MTTTILLFLAFAIQAVMALLPNMTQKVFDFESITGPFSAGQVVTGTIGLGDKEGPSFTPSPFAVVLSASDSGPLTTITIPPLPSPTNPQTEIFFFTVPTTLSATGNLEVLIQYTDNPNNIVTLGTVDITTATTTTGASTDSLSPTVPSTPSAANSTPTDSSSSSSNSSSSTAPTSAPSTQTPSSPSALGASGGNSTKARKLGAIIGGTIGAVVVALLALIALILYNRRKRQASGRPMTFHGDMMVKTPEPQAFTTFEHFGVGSRARRSRSMASSRNSSIDSQNANEKTPALGVYSRQASSRASEDGNGETSYRYPSSPSSGMSGYESARGPSRLSPRTDRQMQLEEKIQILKAQMISLSDELSGESADSHDSQIGSIRARIKRLEKLESSDWALSLTNEVPSEFLS